MKFNKLAEDVIKRARTALYIEEPMYGILALRLQLEQDSSIKTMCVSHRTMYYNPDFVLELADKSKLLMKSAVAHEVLHCVYDHIDRIGGRIPGKWNAACDYVVNAGLKRDGFDLDSKWLFNQAFDGMTADHIYSLLPDSDENGNGPGADGGWGAMDEMQPGDPADAEANAAEWKVATIQAANAAKAQGKLPASMQVAVDAALGNKVNWRERLRRFVSVHSKNDYSWNRPQRRMLPYGYYLPSLHSESMGLLVPMIDTSGSVDDYTLNVFGSEIRAIKSAVRPIKLINIYCDARVNKVDEFGEHDQLTFRMVGRGGTDFRPPFRYIEEHDLKPACAIYLTDGEGPFPATPPPYPVMWVMTGDVIAPFGETVRIEP